MLGRHTSCEMRKLLAFGIKAKDAIHIATVMDHGIKTVHTYDGFANKWEQLRILTNISICKPQTATLSVFDLAQS